MDARTISRREVLVWVLWLFVLGAGIRLWFVIAEHPPAEHVVSDMWVHDFRARRLLHGPLDAWDTFTPVGYPALLAAVYAFAGAAGPTVVGVLQALLGGATAAFTYLVGLRLAWAAIVAPVAGLAVALHFPLVFYSGLLMTEVLFAFLLVLGVWALIRATEAPSGGRALSAGLVLGAAAVVRPNLAVAAPFVAFYLWLACRAERRAWRAIALRIGLAAAVPVAIAAVHNSRLAERPVVLGTNGGLNFFANFAEVATIRYEDETGFVHRITTVPNLLAYEGVYDSPRPFHDAGWFYRQGWKALSAHPRRLLRTLDNVVEGTGIGAQDYWPGWREHPTLVRRHARWFGWLAVLPALAYLGWLLASRRVLRSGEAVPVLLAGLLASTFVVMAFLLGDPRMRVPFDPLIILLAVGGAGRLVAYARRAFPAAPPA